MKRLTETSKWSDPWFRKLSPGSKLLWCYILDNCNCIGEIELDDELASLQIGVKVTDKLIKELGERVKVVSGWKLFVPKFIHFQNGELSEGCPAHKPVLKLVRERGLSRVGIVYQYPSDTLLQAVQPPPPAVQRDEKPTVFREPTREELNAYAEEIGLSAHEVDRFVDYYTSNGWMVGRTKMKDWKAAMRNWKTSSYRKPNPDTRKNVDHRSLQEHIDIPVL